MPDTIDVDTCTLLLITVVDDCRLLMLLQLLLIA